MDRASLLRKTVAAALAVGLLQMVGASEQTTSPASALPKEICVSPVFRQFDFWVGDWDVSDPDGKLQGRNVVAKDVRGCAIVERWTSVAGGQGLSLNYYDPAAKKWKQHWVGLGLIVYLEGGMEKGAMVLEGPLQYLGKDMPARLRSKWTPLAGGKVSHQIEYSEDSGKTWAPWFDGRYSPRQGK